VNFSQASPRDLDLRRAYDLKVDQLHSAKTIYPAKLKPEMEMQLQKALTTPPPAEE
jgi:hypothetical protein